MPTMPSPSPPTTSAVKLNRRPPLTTLATRLIVTTRSRCGVFSATSRAPRPSRPPRPPRPSRPPSRPPPSVLVPDPEPRRCGPGMTVHSFLELESSAASGVGQGCDATLVPVATAVEDHFIDARGLGPLGYERTDLGRDGLLVAVGAPDRGVQRRGRGQRVTLGVVDDLGRDVA